MVRNRRLRKRVSASQFNYEAIAILLLSSAQTPEEELAGLAVAQLAFKQKNQNRRYGFRGPYGAPKSEDFLDVLLSKFSDRWFKAWMRCVQSSESPSKRVCVNIFCRMSREAFDHLLSLIKTDRVFESQGKRPQRCPKYQLATFLTRMGAESGVKTAGAMSIAEGSTYLYARRVVKAIRNLRDDHLAWPGPARRQFLANAMEDGWGFPGCIGIGDGSYIRLADKPTGRNPWAYWCRKKFYAVSTCGLPCICSSLKKN
jgi:hypothetical protein